MSHFFIIRIAMKHYIITVLTTTIIPVTARAFILIPVLLYLTISTRVFLIYKLFSASR